MVLLVVAGAGLAVGGLIAMLAKRWPAIEAPRVAGETIVEEVEQHPTLARHLRRHFDPTTETGVALTVAAVFVIGVAVAVGVLLTLIRIKFGLQSVDARLARFAGRHASEWSTDVMHRLTEMGGTRGVIVVAAVACIVAYVRRPSRSLPIFMTVVVAGQFALSNGIKYLVDRARPEINQLTGHAGTSFPSGHATAAAATLAAVALILTRGRSKRAKIAAASVAAGLAAMVAATRVFLGVHWFSDVVAGLLLGWAWFALCSIAFGGRVLRFGAPVATAEVVADTVPG